MSMRLPPDMSTLRAFVRNELPAEDHRAVNRWCGRCVDPELLDVLDWLAFEWREEQADANLPMGWLQSVTQAFANLVDQQRAAWGATEFGQSLAFLGSAEQSALTATVITEHTVRLAATAEPGAAAAVLLFVDDFGGAGVLWTLTRSSSAWPTLPEQDWQVQEAEGRVTIWLVVASQPGLAAEVNGLEAEPLGLWLSAVLTRPDVSAHAVRLVP
jgi:hypothetical protein